jgi:hypothetical protein
VEFDQAIRPGSPAIRKPAPGPSESLATAPRLRLSAYGAIQQAWIGALTTPCIVYVYLFLLLSFEGKALTEAWAIAMGMAILSCVFVVPLGAILGFVVQRFSRDRGRLACVANGVIIGFWAAAIFASIAAIFEREQRLNMLLNFDFAGLGKRSAEIWDRAVWYGMTMAPICAAWVGIWAYVVNRKAAGSH